MNCFLRILPPVTRYILPLLLLIASLAAAVNAAPSTDSLLYYTSARGRFALMMPQPISLHEQSQTYSLDLHPYAQLSGASLDCQQLAAKDYGAVWFVIYCDYPAEALADLSTDEILDNARDSAFNNNKPLLLSESEMLYDNRFPGRTLLYQLDAHETDAEGNAYTNLYKARAYMVDNRLYWIGAWVPDDQQDNNLSIMDTILESFHMDTPTS